ncbi:hypothetical protein [Nitrosopumilus sp.]|uniref:hypothetical protein n=1 Tax=Nitrosopumilus sp. TaxID=2024843 RepID=UPI003B5C0E63
MPVANRYFGAKNDGENKIRGIETRRHDTPKFFKKCQLEILDIFSSCKTIADVKASITEAKLVQKKYQDILLSQKASPTELTFINRITKGTDGHKTNTIQADAINQLKWAGKLVEPGQNIQYIISNYSRKLSKRVIPKEIMDRDEYDVKHYSKLLDGCCKTIIGPLNNFF